MPRVKRTAEPPDPSHLDREGLLALVRELQAKVDEQQQALDWSTARLAELQPAAPPPNASAPKGAADKTAKAASPRASKAKTAKAPPPAESPALPASPSQGVKKAMKPIPGAAFTVVFDGGSINNPGRGYGSYQIVDATGKIAAEASLDYGMGVSNNAAEYRSLIAALERVIALAGMDARAARVAVRGDSQLVIRQVKGEWKVNKEDLKPLHRRVRDLTAQLQHVDLQWHGRSNSVRILGH